MYRNPAAASWGYSGPGLNPQVEPFHRSLPDYAVTPLVPLPDLARQLGLAQVLLKDESNRLGLPAFKILGASWAVFKAVAAQCNLPLTSTLDEVGLAAKRSGIRLVTCTEGNWGRAVSRMAKYLHITAIIFVPNFMDQATQRKIESEGAEVVVVEGDYDFSIKAAREEADRDGLLVMDVSWEGYDEIPEVVVTLHLLELKGLTHAVGCRWIHFQRNPCHSLSRRRIMGSSCHYALQKQIALCNGHYSRAGHCC
jgi:diaminopropionate ammonia-lyase